MENYSLIYYMVLQLYYELLTPDEWCRNASFLIRKKLLVFSITGIVYGSAL